MERLNPALPPEVITAAVDELTRDLLLFIAQCLRGQQTPLPEPRLFSDEQLPSLDG